MGAVFDALGDATRRQILEVLAAGEQTAGSVVDEVQARQSISQPAVSQHLRVLREARLVDVRAEGTRRYYAIDRDGLDAAQAWLTQLTDPAGPFAQPLDALATEVARGKRDRRRADDATTDADAGGRGRADRSA